MHIIILWYSVLIKFVPTTTATIETHRFIPIERFSYQMPLQFRIACMFNEAVSVQYIIAIQYYNNKCDVSGAIIFQCYSTILVTSCELRTSFLDQCLYGHKQ